MQGIWKPKYFCIALVSCNPQLLSPPYTSLTTANWVRQHTFINFHCLHFARCTVHVHVSGSGSYIVTSEDCRTQEDGLSKTNTESLEQRKGSPKVELRFAWNRWCGQKDRFISTHLPSALSFYQLVFENWWNLSVSLSLSLSLSLSDKNVFLHTFPCQSFIFNAAFP